MPIIYKSNDFGSQILQNLPSMIQLQWYDSSAMDVSLIDCQNIVKTVKLSIYIYAVFLGFHCSYIKTLENALNTYKKLPFKTDYARIKKKQ